MNIFSKIKTNHYQTSGEYLEQAILNGEGKLGVDGQFCVTTGEFTGRAANDKYLVNDGLKDVSFGQAGKSMSRDQMIRLTDHMQTFMEAVIQDDTVYVTYLKAGGKTIKLISQYSWHCLFARNLFLTIDPVDSPDLTIVDLPICHAVPEFHGTSSKTFIAADFSKGLVLIGGTQYAGEIKKSVFSYLSYLAPEENVLPMHSSVTTDLDGGYNTTVFFGLSGTGKTTLSAFKGGMLLGDDEHLWSDDGVQNIEAGCYAKAIKLSPEKEPAIWNACHKFGTVLENVVVSKDREIDFNDSSIAENTRAGYPLHYIEDSHKPGTIVSHPKNIIMLTCDAFGVLPGVAQLDKYSAAYHFISGYTAKVAGTEKGVTEPTAAFSPCFGGPFMAKRIDIYAKLFMNKIEKYKPNVWLVNTGWIGGGPGVGKRMDINETRQIIAQIVSGKLKDRSVYFNSQFSLWVPEDTYNNNPQSSWSDPVEYNRVAQNLIEKFTENEKRFVGISDPEFVDVIEFGRIKSDF
jgi:phosphoenolpyruvate carboxykinase (ATP)